MAQEETLAVAANAEIAIAEVRRQEAVAQHHRNKEYIAKLNGERLLSFARLCQQLECTHCCAHRQVRVKTPKVWKMWDVKLPSRKPLHCEVAKIHDRLVVGGYSGQLHVLKEDQREWDTYVRPSGDIYEVVTYKDDCLLQIYDKVSHKYVIQRFLLSEEGHCWQDVAVMPDELQLKGVAFAVSGDWLYAVGGRCGDWECINTARACNIETGKWYNINDMKYRRSSCSSVVVNKTLYVGGGGADGGELCRDVEGLRLQTGEWFYGVPTACWHATLSAFNNNLLSTGGLTNHGFSKANVVQLFDEEIQNWLPLPSMLRARYRHGACALSSGELVVAEGGGGGSSTYTIESMNLGVRGSGQDDECNLSFN